METFEKEHRYLLRSHAGTSANDQITTAESWDVVDSDEVDIRGNPLQNPLIIHHVFQFLDLEAIKQSRLVCRKWNDLSLSFLDKNSLIRIGYPEKVKGYEFEKMSPKNFKEFRDGSERCFRAFKLKPFSCHKGEWPLKTLVRFLEEQREIMKELTIENIVIRGYDIFNIYPPKYFSISPYLSNDLTKLTIDNSFSGSKITVSMNKSTSFKNLSLTNCGLNVLEECKMSPEKLKLNYVGIFKNGLKTASTIVNELVDFKHLKELSLKSPKDIDVSRVYGFSLLEVDMSGKTTLDTLTLKSTKIYNAQKCQWKINGKLKLRQINYTTETQMKFTELDFGKGTISLNALPSSVEKLMLKLDERRERQTRITYSPFWTMPNLRYLELLANEGETEDDENDEWDDQSEDDDDESGGEDNEREGGEGNIERVEGNNGRDEADYENRLPLLASLRFFTNCEHLTTVKLRSKTIFDENGDLLRQDFNEEWIPPSIKILLLAGNFRLPEIREPREFQLEKLVIQNVHLEDIIATVKCLKSKNLILDLNPKSLKWTKKLEPTILALINMPYDSVAIGPWDIPETTFKKGAISNYVDQRAQYYVFKNQIGKSIMEIEFKKLMKEQ